MTLNRKLWIIGLGLGPCIWIFSETPGRHVGITDGAFFSLVVAGTIMGYMTREMPAKSAVFYWYVPIWTGQLLFLSWVLIFGAIVPFFFIGTIVSFISIIALIAGAVSYGVIRLYNRTVTQKKNS